MAGLAAGELRQDFALKRATPDAITAEDLVWVWMLWSVLGMTVESCKVTSISLCS